jgi:hypothetical protein
MVDFPHLMEGFLGGRGNLGWGFHSLGVLPTATKQALREGKWQDIIKCDKMRANDESAVPPRTGFDRFPRGIRVSQVVRPTESPGISRPCRSSPVNFPILFQLATFFSL